MFRKPVKCVRIRWGAREALYSWICEARKELTIQSRAEQARIRVRLWSSGRVGFIPYHAMPYHTRVSFIPYHTRWVGQLHGICGTAHPGKLG